MIQPSALNVLIITLSMLIGIFLMRMLAAYLVSRNPDSGAGQALGSLVN